MAHHMDFARNTSTSFRCFTEGLAALKNERAMSNEVSESVVDEAVNGLVQLSVSTITTFNQ